MRIARLIGKYKSVYKNNLFAFFWDGDFLNLHANKNLNIDNAKRELSAKTLIELSKKETITKMTSTRLKNIAKFADLFPVLSPFDHIINPADSY